MEEVANEDIDFDASFKPGSQRKNQHDAQRPLEKVEKQP